jgi:hypothetical protein
MASKLQLPQILLSQFFELDNESSQWRLIDIGFAYVNQ